MGEGARLACASGGDDGGGGHVQPCAHLLFHLEMNNTRGEHENGCVERSACPRLQRAKDAAAPVPVPTVVFRFMQVVRVLLISADGLSDGFSTPILLFCFQLQKYAWGWLGLARVKCGRGWGRAGQDAAWLVLHAHFAYVYPLYVSQFGACG